MAELILIHCNVCKHHTNHTIVHEEIDRPTREMLDQMEIPIDFYEYRYQLAKCMGCDTCTLVRIYTDSENINPEIHYFPKRDENFFQSELVPYGSLPPKVMKIYEETINAYNEKNYTLSAIGLRAVIEAVCLNKRIRGGTIKNKRGAMVFSGQLNGKINGLFEKKYLVEKNAKILHSLRFMGNEAAHEITTPSKEELKTALEIIEPLLKTIYSLEKKNKSLKMYRKFREEN